MTVNSDVSPVSAETPKQWHEHILGAKNLQKYTKLYIVALATSTLLIDGAAIMSGGNYLDLDSNTKFIYGSVSVSAFLKCGGTVFPKIRQWALDKIKSEGKQLEGLNDPEALEIKENLHKITVLASTDNSNFKNQIQSLWPLVAAVSAGSLNSPYNYLSSSLAALGSLAYVAHSCYLFYQSAHKADKLFTKLEAKYARV